MRRRLSEDRNQHYNDLTCACWTDAKAMARFKEQPKRDCWCCKNVRGDPMSKGQWLTLQERRFLCEPVDGETDGDPQNQTAE